MPRICGPNHHQSQARADRAADYFELRAAGFTRERAAQTLGLSVRTTFRYDKKGQPADA